MIYSWAAPLVGLRQGHVLGAAVGNLVRRNDFDASFDVHKPDCIVAVQVHVEGFRTDRFGCQSAVDTAANGLVAGDNKALREVVDWLSERYILPLANEYGAFGLRRSPGA